MHAILITLCLTFWSAALAKETLKIKENAPVRAWAHEESDISADSNVIYGQLSNGMRYVIMRNQEPPGRVSMRLHIAAGSLMERDDQRGVAKIRCNGNARLSAFNALTETGPQ